MNNCTIHPIIAESLNEEQQAAVMIEENAVVAAGAGSGKTFTLARRFSYLVIERNIPVERILTLTFTDKAAAEMYGRIYHALKEIESKAEKGSTVQQRADRAVCDFYKARIQTLDSYCRTIVKKASRRYGITPEFTTDKETAAQAAKRDSLPFFLKYRNTEALQAVVLTRKPEEAADSLFAYPALEYTSLARTINLSDDLNRQCTEICRQWEAAVSSLSQDIRTVFSQFEQMPSSKKPSKSELQMQSLIDSYVPSIEDNVPEAAQLAVFFNEWTADQQKKMEEVIVPFVSFIYKLSKLKFQLKSTTEAQTIVQTRDSVKKKYYEFSAMANFILQYSKIQAVLPIIEEFQKNFSETKRRSGILTFADSAELAVKILKEHPDIRYSEQSLFDAVMIDEFQDDNELQRDLLFYLAEESTAAQANADQMQANEDKMQTADQVQTAPGLRLSPSKLFFVGDEKQSIYRFRGADVSVFRDLKQRFNSSVTLSTNYRSHPALIAGFNSLFGGYDYPQQKITSAAPPPLNTKRSAVFLHPDRLQSGAAMPGFEAEYTYVEASFTDKKTKERIEADNMSRIHICILDKKKRQDSEDADSSNSQNISAAASAENDSSDYIQDGDFLSPAENEAVYTARKIRTIIDKGTSAGISYQEKDIAILVRSYTNQYLYEKHLRMNGIHYTCENLVGFFGDAPVNDLYHILRLIVYPDDIASYAAVLRSPFARISIQGHDACIADIDTEHFTPFPDYSLTYLNQHDSQAYLNARDRYRTLAEKAKTNSAAQMISSFWYNEGYRYETMWNMDVALFGELYDFLYELARRADDNGTGISGIVDTLAGYRDSGERIDDLDIPIERAGAVRIMSIHKSKGLEFPVVFICGAAAGGRKAFGSDLVNYDKTWGITVNCGAHPLIPECKTNYFYAKSDIAERQMREAELRRLLYVAMTRAEQELYITMSLSGVHEQKANKDNADSSTGDNHLTLPDDHLSSNDDYDAIQNAYYEFAQRWTQKKIEDAEKKLQEQLAPSYVIPNDTFAGFLLPAAAAFNDETITYKPAIFEEIKRMTRNETEMSDTADESHQIHTIDSIQKTASPCIENAAEITTPLIYDCHISPSLLGGAEDFSDDTQRPAQAGSFPEIDEIVASVPNGQFGYNDFGTIAHTFAESMFTGINASVQPRIKAVLTDRQFAQAVSAAQFMAERFAVSALGQRAKEAVWRKNEYAFKLKTKKNGLIITGSIDLVFEEDSKKLVIVDFKTDANELPEIHAAQLTAYRHAAAGFRNIPLQNTQCFLYYLRSGNAVDITHLTDTIDIEREAELAWELTKKKPV